MIDKLADIIEKHPNAYMIIDNDSWSIFDGEPKYSESYEPENMIANSDQYPGRGKWYGFNNEYGHIIAEAFIVMLNRKGFNIKVG